MCLFTIIHDKGIEVGRYHIRTIMRNLNLKVNPRIDYKVITNRIHSDEGADKLINQNFNPVGTNEVRAGDNTYLNTGEG